MKHVLYTHKHWDHAGGIDQLLKMLNDSSVKSYIGFHDHQHVPLVNTVVNDKDEVSVGPTAFKVYSVPCHTRGHVIYHFSPPKNTSVQSIQKTQYE